MGYYTRYEVSAEPWSPDLDADLKEASGGYEFDNGVSGSVKWYEWKDNMLNFSKEHPNTLFTVHGEGEENDDFWNAYFRDGKMQICKGEIIYPPFDESKLSAEKS